MRKSLLLAPPLASLLLLAGCCNTGTCDTASTCPPAAPACAPSAPAPSTPIVVAQAEPAVVVDVGVKPDAAVAPVVVPNAPIVVAGAPALVGTGVNTPGDDHKVAAKLAEATAPTGDSILTEDEYVKLLAEGKVTAIPGYTPDLEVAAAKTASKSVAAAEPVIAAKAQEEESLEGAIIERRSVAETSVMPAVVDKGAKDALTDLTSKEEAITEDQLVSPSLVITPAQINNYAASKKSADSIIASAPVAAPPVTAPTAKVVSSSAVPTIPGMPLPEGWDYIHELDLTGGRVNNVAIDQLYSRGPVGSDLDI